MQPIHRFRTPILPLVVLIVLVVPAASARPLVADAAEPIPGQPVPGRCVQYSAAQDYRCAGLLVNNGWWAGQWLFTDDDGHYRLGTCAFHLGTHPTAAVPARRVGTSLPNDPGAVRSGYLMWRYGWTTDDLTAAAMWAVMHYYAQDTAGGGALIPSLDAIGAVTGRADVQQRAQALVAEADLYTGEWTLVAELTPDGQLALGLAAGAVPVPDRQISVLVSGVDAPVVATTGADGTTTVAVTLPNSGTVTVVASTTAPLPAATYAGQPATPDPDGVQTLLTGGGERTLRATAQLTIEPPTTTTTEPPPTTTTTAPGTTDPGTTVAVEPPTTTIAPPPTQLPLPATGGRGDGGVPQLATALLVGGVGLLGTLRRREAPLTRRRVDSGG